MPYLDPEQKRAYQREWCRRRRAEFIEGRSCEQCGSAAELEFHHVDPETKITHRLWSYSKERIAAELAKCVVLCDGCHNALHMAARYGREPQLSIFGGAR